MIDVLMNKKWINNCIINYIFGTNKLIFCIFQWDKDICIILIPLNHHEYGPIMIGNFNNGFV